jgi:uncharacterized protein
MTNVVITGASSGLGAALAIGYAQRKAHVILVARRATHLERVAESVRNMGGEPIVVVADVSREEDCDRVVSSVLDMVPHVDVLINNAGRGHFCALEDLDTDTWHSMFSVNVDAAFFLTRGVLPGMKRRNAGHIVNIASVAGTMGFPYNAAYVAAKHALVGLTAATRAELVGTNVHATIVNPAGVVTEWGDVTDGGSINELYAKAIPRSRTIANELGIGLAPLFKLMSADRTAQIIMDAVDRGRTSDIFTHEGSRDLAVQAVTDRVTLEDRHLALWLAMKETYEREP